MLQKLQQIDLQVMIFFNKKLENSFFDFMMPWLRESIFWAPLYLYLIVWGFMNLGKKAGWWVAWAILTIALSDQVSSGFLKNTIARVRPCRDPDVLPYITLRLENCSGAFSFTSSHAANHFALAMFVFSSLAPIIGTRLTRWLFVWAAAICYAQVYVGVHYPFDVVGGTLVGLACGWVTSYFYLLKARAIDRQPIKSGPQA
jgi:membrane-associated phospholipid phosphatase